MIGAILTGIICALGMAQIPKFPKLSKCLAESGSAAEKEWAAIERKRSFIFLGCAVTAVVLMLAFKLYAKSARLTDPFGPAVIGVSVLQLVIVLFGLGIGARFGSRARKVLRENSLSQPVKFSRGLQIVFGIVGWVGFFILIQV